MLWVNYKTYPRGIGDRGVGLAQMCEDLGEELRVPVAICPQVSDIYRFSQQVTIDLWAQHVDPIEPGANTGWVLPESVHHAGAMGVLINHSEHRLSPDVIRSTVVRCHDVGLKTMVFVGSVEEARSVSDVGSEYVAFEPPELVGGNVSVAEADAAQLREFRDAVTHSHLIAGAGVHSKRDIDVCLDLGIDGVLVASAVMQKSEEPRELLLELIGAFVRTGFA